MATLEDKEPSNGIVRNKGCRDCACETHKPKKCVKCGCGTFSYDEPRSPRRQWGDPVLRTLWEYHGCDPDQIQRKERD